MERDAKAVRSFEDLAVFKRAYRVSLAVHQSSLNFPKVEQYALGDQVRRASKNRSVPTLPKGSASSVNRASSSNAF